MRSLFILAIRKFLSIDSWNDNRHSFKIMIFAFLNIQRAESGLGLLGLQNHFDSRPHLNHVGGADKVVNWKGWGQVWPIVAPPRSYISEHDLSCEGTKIVMIRTTILTKWLGGGMSGEFRSLLTGIYTSKKNKKTSDKKLLRILLKSFQFPLSTSIQLW